MNAFTTRDDAFETAVLPTLGVYADDYDLDALKAAVITRNENGLYEVLEGEAFWNTVAASEK